MDVLFMVLKEEYTLFYRIYYHLGRLFIGKLPTKYKYLREGKYDKFFEKTRFESLDKTDKQLYKIFHSLVIWFAIYKLINGEKEFLCLTYCIYRCAYAYT